MKTWITLISIALCAALTGCKSSPDAAPDAASSSEPAPIEGAERAYQGVESRIDGCDWGVYSILNVEGTAQGRASWACEGVAPEEPRDLVVGDCVQLTSQRWCVHAIEIVDEGSDEPGSSEDAIVLVPEG